MSNSTATVAPVAPQKSFADNFTKRTAFVEKPVPALEPVSGSSMLFGLLYDGRRQVLFAHFKKGGNVYEYAKVTRAQFEGVKSGSLDPKGENSVGRALQEAMIDKETHKPTQIAAKYDCALYGWDANVHG